MKAKSYLVVVGVDGSDGARAALRWAVREAHRRGGSVQAICAWRWDLPVPGNRRVAEELLEHEIESLPRFTHTDVPIALEAAEGRAAEVLVEAARGADLLVLGSHGRSRQLQQVLGSVSEECIRDATCPVVVIPVGYHDGASTPDRQRLATAD